MIDRLPPAVREEVQRELARMGLLVEHVTFNGEPACPWQRGAIMCFVCTFHDLERICS